MHNFHSKEPIFCEGLDILELTTDFKKSTHRYTYLLCYYISIGEFEFFIRILSFFSLTHIEMLGIIFYFHRIYRLKKYTYMIFYFVILSPYHCCLFTYK
jgi:hypothetical protein